MIDRPVRPLFDEGFKNETQVIALVLSADPEIEPGCTLSLALRLHYFVSNIPFTKPVAAVRVGLIDGRYVINPTFTELKNSRLNLAVAGMEEGIVMVNAERPKSRKRSWLKRSTQAMRRSNRSSHCRRSCLPQSNP
jgi:polyribonucleotide nucleotidyltransferase